MTLLQQLRIYINELRGIQSRLISQISRLEDNSDQGFVRELQVLVENNNRALFHLMIVIEDADDNPFNTDDEVYDFLNQTASEEIKAIRVEFKNDFR